MYIYKSHCRFNLLLALQDKIIEVRPGEIIESEYKIDHPNLILVGEKGNIKCR
jgi:hypothetical protein